MYFKTKIFLIFFLILSFIFNAKDVFAVKYFSDNFDGNNLDNWEFIINDSSDYPSVKNSWTLVDGKLLGEVTWNQSSFLLAKSFWNLSDYSIRFDSINENGVDQEIVFRINESRSKYYLLNLRFKDSDWYRDGGEIVLWKYDSSIGYKRLSTFNNLTQINLTQNEIHKIKIEANDSDIKIYFDSILIIDINDEDPILEGSFGFYNWGGSFCYGSSRNIFDNLIVGDFNYDDTENPTPTPTSIPIPTPTPIPNPKIIIIPGFGASWNSDAIVYNKIVENDQWKMTPFVGNYNALLKTLDNNGLNRNNDYYVWNYDWRKPVRETVNDLNEFINNNIEEGDVVNLIGHSMGALILRIWAEENSSDARLGKVFVLGSPNLGSVEAYSAWNGGQVFDLSKFNSIALNILLKLQSIKTKTRMEAVHKYTPSVKDLLPTFDYLYKDGVLLSRNNLKYRNDYLELKNETAPNLDSKLKLIVGTGHQTLSAFTLKGNNYFDKVFGLWPEGRTKDVVTEDGDGTVLIKSANYSKSDVVTLESNHGEIVDETINMIMAELGLNQMAADGETTNFKNNLVFFVGSPVKYSVNCDESVFDEVDGFVVIKNNDYNSCEINMKGIGDGTVHVVSGNTNYDDWLYLERDVKNGEFISYDINPDNGYLIKNTKNLEQLKSLISSDINLLLTKYSGDKKLKEALTSLKKNHPRLIIKNIFDFRIKFKEDLVTRNIINNSKVWSSMVDKCSVNKNGGENCVDKIIEMGFAREIVKKSQKADYSWWLLEDSDL